MPISGKHFQILSAICMVLVVKTATGQTASCGEISCQNEGDCWRGRCYCNVRWTGDRCQIDLCPTQNYNNKFFPVYSGSWPGEFFYDDGVAACDACDGVIANFYSQSQLVGVMDYIRDQDMFGQHRTMVFHTGLSFDPLTSKLTLRDGSAAPSDLKWIYGYPYTGKRFADYTRVMLSLSQEPSGNNVKQYLFNYFPYEQYNVICEVL